MPFPTPGRRVRVSAAGGRWPRWSREGSEIVYLAPDSTLMSAPLTVTPKRLDVGAVRPLFKIHPRPMVRLDAYPYAIAPDGRLLVNTFVDDTTPTDITLVVNWAATLGR
jgi:hypothetical protein